jgi:Cft2 family RNA processing exonuclease
VFILRPVESHFTSGQAHPPTRLPHATQTQIHRTVSAGGKVLIPVSAVGRAQELLMLLHEHWERTQLEVSVWPGWSVCHAHVASLHA